MLSCKAVADRASALIDGDLSAWDALQMRLHLAMCKGCGRFIEQMWATDRLTAQIVEIDDPDAPPRHEAENGGFAEVLSTLRKEQPRR